MTKQERICALAEERRLRWEGVKPEKKLRVCFNCARWVRHYVDANPQGLPGCGPKFVPIDLGHCIYPRLKSEAAHDTCEHFATLRDLAEEEITTAFMTGWHGVWEEGRDGQHKDRDKH